MGFISGEEKNKNKNQMSKKQEHTFHINYFSLAVFWQIKTKPKNLFSYLQHQNHSLHYIPLRLPTVDDDSETTSFALLTAEIQQKNMTFNSVT